MLTRYVVSGSFILHWYCILLPGFETVPMSSPLPVAVHVLGTVHHSSTVALSSGRSLQGHQDLAPSGSDRVETAVPNVPPLVFRQLIEPNPVAFGAPL